MDENPLSTLKLLAANIFRVKAVTIFALTVFDEFDHHQSDDDQTDRKR